MRNRTQKPNNTDESVSKKRVVLGVSGSIAAYKAAELSRRLVLREIDVPTVLSRSARNFIGPATFAGITGREPVTDLSTAAFTHLDLVEEADAFVIAPATANILGKLAAGIADCALTTSVLAAKCPIMICPAMNETMWFSRVNQRNVSTLASLGYELIGPQCGSLACGDDGWGRLASVDAIERAIVERLESTEQLAGRKFIVTAGPTREYLDPVRFLSNPSSGKTGYAIAEELARRGGETILISGPTSLRPSGLLRFIEIESALELRDAIGDHFVDAHAVVMTAAVADHRFAHTVQKKIAKEQLSDTISLERNPDILRELGAQKARGQVLVGFAAQTHDMERSARQKLVDKNLDLLICTKVGRQEGFGVDQLEALMLTKEDVQDLGFIEKRVLAGKLADALAALLPSASQPAH